VRFGTAGPAKWLQPPPSASAHAFTIPARPKVFGWSVRCAPSFPIWTLLDFAWESTTVTFGATADSRTLCFSLLSLRAQCFSNTISRRCCWSQPTFAVDVSLPRNRESRFTGRHDRRRPWRCFLLPIRQSPIFLPLDSDPGLADRLRSIFQSSHSLRPPNRTPLDLASGCPTCCIRLVPPPPRLRRQSRPIARLPQRPSIRCFQSFVAPPGPVGGVFHLILDISHQWQLYFFFLRMSHSMSEWMFRPMFVML
jgi:hypothetical protein